MPLYEYVCPTCDQRFDTLRSMDEADDPVRCVQGLPARRALSVFARTTGDAPGGGEVAVPGAGGCCGGACGCG